MVGSGSEVGAGGGVFRAVEKGDFEGESVAGLLGCWVAGLLGCWGAGVFVSVVRL